MKKKVLCFIIAAVMILSSVAILASCSDGDDGDTITLNVYNWGEYLPRGEDRGYNANAEFEKWYEETYGQKIKVNYDTYTSNEELRAKLEANAVSYDIIIPSDYMIDYFVQHDMLEEINFDNIPNYSNITDEFKNLYYDPENKFSVPYTYGTVGIIYDANKVDSADVTGWDIMWNEKYKDAGILQFNNSRDAFGTAMYKLGIDVNTTDKALWDKAYEELVKQKSIWKGRVMDEIYNAMESGEAAIAAYYAGDYFTMLDNQADSVDLQFYSPDETNVFVDAMCIPKGCRNKDAAEAYINFMLSKEAGIEIAEYIYYASPNSAVYNDAGYKEDMGEDVLAVIYPENFNFGEAFNKYAYRNLDTETLDYLTQLWEELIIE